MEFGKPCACSGQDILQKHSRKPCFHLVLIPWHSENWQVEGGAQAQSQFAKTGKFLAFKGITITTLAEHKLRNRDFSDHM